jgi:hypothetical protein
VPVAAVRDLRPAADGGPSPWYVGAAVTSAPANLCARAAAAAAALALTGCGGGDERRDAGVADATYTVAVQRASFPREQRLARRSAFVISVRNAGERTIPNLVVTVRGFTGRASRARNADAARDLWIVDRGPAGAATAFEDTWDAGRLAPARTATLRWDVTPVVAGRHELTYEVAPGLAGGGRAVLARGGAPRGSLTVRVTDRPAQARVDPRTGRIVRRE